jgi:small subunit ribosomal protein S3
MAGILEKSLLRLTQTQVKIRFIPLYSSSNKRYNRSLLYIERSMRFLNSLSYIHLFDTSLSTKNASLLAQFIALNLHLHIRNVRFFLRFLDRLMNLFVKHYSFKGIKLCIKGRLNGARRARSLIIQKGKVPLNTLSSDISFGFANSMTIYGVCGVKVWLYF